MNFSILALLFMLFGFVVDYMDKQKKNDTTKKKSSPKIAKTKETVIHPLTKQPIHMSLSSLLQTRSVQQNQLSSTKSVKRNENKQVKQHAMSVYTDDYVEEVWEDEEAFETELTTPMSMVVDEEALFSDSQWEAMATQSRLMQPDKTRAKKTKKQRTALQKAYIYSEIFGKPKGSC